MFLEETYLPICPTYCNNTGSGALFHKNKSADGHDYVHVIKSTITIWEQIFQPQGSKNQKDWTI